MFLIIVILLMFISQKEISKGSRYHQKAFLSFLWVEQVKHRVPFKKGFSSLWELLLDSFIGVNWRVTINQSMSNVSSWTRGIAFVT